MSAPGAPFSRRWRNPSPPNLARTATLLALLLAAAGTFGLLVRSAPAQEPEPPGSAVIAALEREVAILSERMTQTEIRESRLASDEVTLSSRVEMLKQAPRSVVRDAELQSALRSLRGVLAEIRNLDNLENILVTTLRTRQVALRQAATAEAERLIRTGQREVRGGNDTDGMQHFAAAFSYLQRGQGGRARNLMGHERDIIQRTTVPEAIPATGRESPDELRALAVILRDSAEKLKLNANATMEELSQLEAERNTVQALQALDGARPSATGLRVQNRLDRRIGELTQELAGIRGELSGRLAQANAMEWQATQYETILLREGATLPRKPR
ncbi:MAG: hypothetical protein OEW11_05590 [Nitrospirota bacterium]|nr:hypothetical protein [Nitrospirota bacterium]